MKILVSACLLGLACRYDGKPSFNEDLFSLIKNHELVPVCPEQLGGLTTPRNPNEILDGKVLEKNGKDNSKPYIRGAKETLHIAKLLKCDFAILKERSPSCGSTMIYDGTFTSTKVPGNGITAQLLKENGFIVLSEGNLDAISALLNKK